MTYAPMSPSLYLPGAAALGMFRCDAPSRLTHVGMANSISERLTQNPLTSWRDLGDYTLLVDHCTGKLLTLSDVAGSIWRAAAEWKTLEEIVRQITMEFDVDYHTAVEDVTRFVCELTRIGLLVSSKRPNNSNSQQRKENPSLNDSVAFRAQIPSQVRSYCQQQNIPLVAFLELTQNCNLRCLHCYNARSHTSELSRLELVAVVDQLAELGALDLVLTGGEPTTHKEFVNILARARSRRFCVTIKTNGTLVNRKLAHEMADSLVVEVHVSLYSMTADEHDAITRRPGSQKKTLQGIEALRAEGLQVRVSCPVTRLNYLSVRRVKEFADSIGAVCGFDPIIGPRVDGTLGPTDLRLREEEWAVLLDNGAIRDVLYPFSENIHDLDVTQGSLAEASDQPFCGAGTSSVAISSCGDVLPCIIYPRAIGNVRGGSIMEIWKSEDAWRAVRGFRARDFVDCGPCEVKDACFRCPAVCLAECGSPNSRAVVFCRAADYYTRSKTADLRVKGGERNAG